jgi:hypothetical protein
MFKLWKDFLEKHSSSGLINPDRLLRFNQAKNFKVIRNFILVHEFFKHLWHFTDDDMKVFVQYLLRRTPNCTCVYPKVTMYKTAKVHASHYFVIEWVEWQKKKMIVL